MNLKPKDQTASLSMLFPAATDEMMIEVGKKLFTSFKMFEALNASHPILTKIVELGGKEQLEAKLGGYHISVVYTKGGSMNGLGLKVEEIASKALAIYETTSTEYALSCYYTGMLMEKVGNYEGPNQDMDDIMLTVIAHKIANHDEVTIEMLLERVDDIIASKI